MTPRTPHPSETAAALQQEGVDRQRAAEDTGPAPPRALVEVVREWRRTKHERDAKPWSNVVRQIDIEADLAERALLAYPLPAPEAPETPR
jgi:hypothetical protein